MRSNGDATCKSGCSWEHPDLKKNLKKKKIFTKFFYTCSVLGIPSYKKIKKLIVLLSSKKKLVTEVSPTDYRGKPTNSQKKKKKTKPQYRAAKQIKSELTSNFLNQKSLKA